MTQTIEKKLEGVYECYQKGDMIRRDFMRFLGLAGVVAGLVKKPFSYMMHQTQTTESIRFDN